MMKAQQDEQVNHRKATEKKLNEAERKMQSFEAQRHEKDDVILNLE